MNFFRKSLRYIGTYILWIVVLLLGALIGLRYYDVLIGSLAIFYVQDEYTRMTQVRFLDRAYGVFAGLVWLGLMVITEELFRKGVETKQTLRRFSAIAGTELLLLGGADLYLMIVQGAASIWLQWIVMIVELGLGAGLIYYVRTTAKK